LFLSRVRQECFIIDTMNAPLKPLKWYRDLADKKSRLSTGAFLLEGDKAIRQVADNQPESILEVLSTGEPPPYLSKVPARHLNESQLEYISVARTPQGLAAVIRIPEDTYSNKLPEKPGDKILLLEDVQDPGNAGTLIRTAAAFGFSGVILSEKCADPFSPKVSQSSAGSVMSLWIRATESYVNLVKELQKSGYNLIAAELEASDNPDTLQRKKTVLVLGNEGAGLSKALLKIADYRISIPIARKRAESLNVAVSGGILMYLSSKNRV